MEQKVLDQCIETIELFSEATGLEAKVLGLGGKTEHSCDEQLCENCVCDHVPKKYCRESHQFGATQARKFGGSYVFFCPIGLVHFISPIVIKSKLVGALLCGHFLMTEPDVFLIRHIQKYVEEDKALKDFVLNVKVLKPSRVRAMSEILKKLAAQISDGSEMMLAENSPSAVDFSIAKHHHSIHKVMNYIKENYMQKISLEEAADQVHFTPQYLSKIFKEETGSTFKQYLCSVRIEKGKKLLVEEDLPLLEVAYLTGFSDQSHFSKSFKKLEGVSPSTYQLSHLTY